MLSCLVDYQSFELLAINIEGRARSLSPFQQGATHVVVKLSSLSILTHQGSTAVAALCHTAEEILACCSSGMEHSWSSGSGQRLGLVKGIMFYDGLPGIFYTDWGRVMYAASPPYQGAGIGLIGKCLMDGSLPPLPASRRQDPLTVQLLSNLNQHFPSVIPLKILLTTSALIRSGFSALGL